MRKLLFLIISLVPLLSSAQEQDSLKSATEGLESRFKPKPEYKIKYKSTVLSVPYRKIRDEGQSPLTYGGPTFQIAKYNERWRKKSITKFEMALGIGMLKTNKHHVSIVTKAPVLNMEVNYHYMRPVMKILKGKGDWYLGGILTNTFDGRLYYALGNNSFGYEFSNAINPATHFTYNFKQGHSERNYQAGFKLNFSLLAHVIRPNYIGMEPDQVYAGEKLKPLALFTHGNKIALPNHFFRINTEIYLDRFNISNKDKFRIFYGWGLHFTSLPQSNPLVYVQHTIGVVTMLYSEKIKKSKGSNKIDFY